MFKIHETGLVLNLWGEEKRTIYYEEPLEHRPAGMFFQLGAGDYSSSSSPGRPGFHDHWGIAGNSLYVSGTYFYFYTDRLVVENGTRSTSTDFRYYVLKEAGI
jgi:hypothetical protein